MTDNRLFTLRFISINAIAFFAFSNLAVFFNLNNYLKDLGNIPESYIGIIISVFSLAALIFNPIFGYFIKPGRGRKSMIISIIMFAVCLLLYPYAKSAWSLTILRFVQGIFFSLMLAATVAEFVTVIPSGKSGQAFGIFSVSNLLPYAVLPPLLEIFFIKNTVSNASHVYAGSAILLLPAILLVLTVIPGKKEGAVQGVTQGKNLSSREIAKEMRRLPVAVLMILNIVVFTIFSILFFFMKEYALKENMGDIGAFFTIQIFVMIGIRVFGGAFFDKVNNAVLLMLSFISAGGGFYTLLTADTPGVVFASAALFGLGLGIGMPIINSAMHRVSSPALVSFNLNILVAMMQVGFILGPVIGSVVIARSGFAPLFLSCVLICVVSMFLSILLIRDLKLPKTQK